MPLARLSILSGKLQEVVPLVSEPQVSRANMVVRRVLFIAILIASSYSYELINHSTSNLHDLETPVDRALPVVPIFAVPYLSFLLFLPLTLLLFAVTSWRRFCILALAVIVASLTADLFYLIFQTYVQRPVVAGSDIGSQLVRLVYAHDQPYNDFPSLHTADSTLAAIAYFRWTRRYGLIVLPLVVAIIAATLLIKQHYLADVLGGLVLAALSYWIAGKVVRRSTDTPRGTVRVKQEPQAARYKD